ncbi:MarP family serine protease [Salinispora arenicola]|uniref:Colicin V production protein n=2 Tax=Salinispora arenicola TaxID=168697 RepID=A0A542XL38_SALAC|nr:MarP family serine protease [Salinispora arenicola]MCN0151815.1 MarP family serine protease [Salinispora arenicola]MCN0180036.1 MarP family serine protease [Salinispora arenicola]NIL42501.1 MarP family serine protease [Salinispora arenicola]NIL58383.1 MarP family serine protease [Salinispora arenicola]NIL63940.1 MarP family serine protease [Salinispora arenicola]
MSAVDLVLLLLMLVFAISGYRQGFVTGVLSFTGFFLGALAGLQIGPLLAQQFLDGGTRVLISLVTVFGLAVMGQALAGWLGSHLRRTITSDVGRQADDIGGAFVSLTAVLLVAWLVAVPLGSSSLPWLAAAVRNSALLTVVDRVLPDQAQELSNALRETVDTNGFPDVFGDLAPTRARQVAPPDPALAGSQVVADSRRAVVKVLGSAPDCSRRIEGSGFVYADDRVMTNAHVVAGTRSTVVELNGDRYDARVVVYDPDRDLAVLYVPGLPGPSMRFAAGNASSGTDAIVLGFPLDGPYNAQSARVRDVDQITGPDIYSSGNVTREVYTIRALVQSGNSGGPLVSTNGLVLGVIFAAAADDPNTGFAVTAAEARPVALAGAARIRGVGTGECT